MAITLERTPIEKQLYAKCLLDAGMSYRKVQRKVQLCDKAVLAIKHSNTYSGVQLDEFKRRLPYKAYRYADDMFDLVTPDEMAKAPLMVKMTTIGIAIDKARDLEGANRPVFNIVNVVHETQEMLHRLKENAHTLSQSNP